MKEISEQLESNEKLCNSDIRQEQHTSTDKQIKILKNVDL